MPLGLVAAYGFGEGEGFTVADASGNGNGGTITGATWTTAGRFGNALVFNGMNSWVTVNDAPSLDLTTAMTLEAWVFPTVAPSGWRDLISKESGSGIAYYLYASGTGNRPATGILIGSVERTLFGTSVLPTSAWRHVAATYDGTQQRLYVGGVQVASRAQTGSIAVTTGPLRLGGNGVWGEYFNGRIDEVRIYNRALTAEQIVADMGRPVP